MTPDSKDSKTNQIMPRFLQSTCIFLLSGLALYACGGQPASDDSTKKADAGSTSKSSGSNLKEEDLDDSSDNQATKDDEKSKIPKKDPLSTTGKPTGELAEGVLVEQTNEFLGRTKVKLCKFGVRLESPSLTCIMLPGKPAIAYNPQNGNAMALTSKSAAMLSGTKTPEPGGETKVEKVKVGTEKIAGLNCDHYRLANFYMDQRTKQFRRAWSNEVWACKDIGAPPAIVKDCARLTLMPPELGFPVRIARTSEATHIEKQKGIGGSQVRQVVNTLSSSRGKFDKCEFMALPGYTTVQDEMKLMVSDDENSLASSGLDDMDSDEAKR